MIGMANPGGKISGLSASTKHVIAETFTRLDITMQCEVVARACVEGVGAAVPIGHTGALQLRAGKRPVAGAIKFGLLLTARRTDEASRWATTTFPRHRKGRPCWTPPEIPEGNRAGAGIRGPFGFSGRGRGVHSVNIQTPGYRVVVRVAFVYT
jgi:hypothetical protein